MFPIFICSIIALAIAIERIVFFKKYIVDLGRFLNPVLNFIKEGHADKFLDQCPKLPNPLGRIIEAGLGEKDTLL
jgi:hypothetical protein